jgi:hypothetical protein
MNFFPSTTTTFAYWKVGTGNPFDGGGFCGMDSVTTAPDGTIVAQVRTKPSGATDLTEQEWEELQEQIIATGRQVVDNGEQWLAAQRSVEIQRLAAARANLESGTPLTAEQASLLTRGL